MTETATGLTETALGTDDVASAHRFEHWRGCMADLVCPMELSREGDGEFRATSRLIQLGSLHVWPAYLQQHHWRRTPKLIRQSDPEFYHLSLPLRGELRISQLERAVVHGPYDMYIVDTSLPFDGQVAGRPAHGVGLEVPKALVPLPADKVNGLLARTLSARDGVGAQLAGFLTRLARDSGSYRFADGHWLETALVDLFTATLAHHLDADDALPSECRRRALILRIEAFIRQHLRDPDLTPGSVAAAHHISTSHLHSLFQDHELTVSAWIRHQRLERARRDLADPGQHAVLVHHIAARWGFTHHAVFSRAFSAAYGLPPRDYRHQALGIDVQTLRQGSGDPGSTTSQPSHRKSGRQTGQEVRSGS